jgi:hypothetical protein
MSLSLHNNITVDSRNTEDLVFFNIKTNFGPTFIKHFYKKHNIPENSNITPTLFGITRYLRFINAFTNLYKDYLTHNTSSIKISDVGTLSVLSTEIKFSQILELNALFTSSFEESGNTNGIILIKKSHL